MLHNTVIDRSLPLDPPVIHQSHYGYPVALHSGIRVIISAAICISGRGGGGGRGGTLMETNAKVTPTMANSPTTYVGCRRGCLGYDCVHIYSLIPRCWSLGETRLCMQHSITNCVLCISTLSEVEVTCTPLIFVMSALYIVSHGFPYMDMSVP